MIELSTPGRICFYGDHQDYLGLPVISGTINRYIYLKAEPIQSSFFVIKLLDFKKSIKVAFENDPETIQPGDYFRSVLFVLKRKGIIPNRGYIVNIFGDLPINAGLSSSSSLVVGWIRFLVQVFAKDKKISDLQIAEWAFEAEVKFFNSPGGIMDQYTIAIGGLMAIDTFKKSYVNLKGNLGSLLVIDSGISKNTLEVLKDARLNSQKAIEIVKKLDKDYHIIKAKKNDYLKYIDSIPIELRAYWKAAIQNFMITKRAEEILKTKNQSTKELAELMNSHQELLCNEIQNTPLEIQKQIKEGIKAGAYAAKIVGSGGGGSIIAMIDPKRHSQIKNAFLKAGAKDVFKVSLINP